MRMILLPKAATLGAVLALSLHAAPALADAYVANLGGGTACTFNQPCGTFQQAHDTAVAGDRITCLDSSRYGAGTFTINKSITIACDGVDATFSASTGNAIVISAGPNDIVTLVGIDIAGTTDANGAGITFATGAALHLHKIKVRGFHSSSNVGAGVYFQPNAYAELYITDSIFADNIGASQASGGIIIVPAGSGSVNAFLSRVRVENNSTGILVDGTLSTGVAVNATVVDSFIVGSQSDGIRARSSAGLAAASVFVDHSVASGNFGSGVKASGATASGAGSATARIGDSTIVLNNIGVSATGAGVLQSYKNNRISGNLTDGTPIPAFVGPGGSALQ
jgi:hypothetical protein